MSGGVLAGIIAGFVGLIVTGVLRSLLAKEVEGWIESLPGYLLRMARARVPSSHRDLLYEEWVAEMHAALHGTEARPVTRLVLGTRYAVGLLRSARRVADELGPARHTPEADPGAHTADEPATPSVTEGQLLRIKHDDVPGPSHGPTVLRILLGTHLRRLREARGVSAQQAAEIIRGSESKISRIELGRNAIREIDILDLLTFYGVDRAEREQLLALAEQANRPDWWHRHTDILPEWFQTYVGMEESAASIRVYEPQFIPGLLQTEDYASAVMSLGDFSPEETERHVMVRDERQRRFADGELRLWVIVGESALRRPVSDTQTHQAQIEYLLWASERPNLTLQVVPYGVGGHAVPSGFSVLRFGDTDLPDIVYVEHLTSALYLDKQADVERYLQAMERLSIMAYEPRETPQILDEIIRQLKGTDNKRRWWRRTDAVQKKPRAGR